MTGTDGPPMGPPPLRAGFVLEQTLGHVTHSRNLTSLLPSDSTFQPVFRRIEFDVSGWAARVPGFGSNWTIRAGVRARHAIRSLLRRDNVDALFIHTQVPATLAGRWLTKVPAIVSIDATPLQYDELGQSYAHERGSDRVEALKHRAHVRCFHNAAHIVSWSHWGRQGLIDHYGVDGDDVTVVAPGVDLSLWEPSGARPHVPGVIRVLFVGGDLQRKGGDVLVDSIVRLRAEFAASNQPVQIELDLVTGSPTQAVEGVVVHRGLQPNSAELIQLYRRADIFCLPTIGDCLPMVLSEAGAAALPLVSTAVGAISEIVRDGQTGILVGAGNVQSVTDALRTLALDDDLRTTMGANARQLVANHFDAAKNALRIVDLIKRAAGGS